jgi:Cu2+-containing amine oxidase
VSDPYGVGDLWVLKYHGNELDDGVNILTGAATRADIDKFVNGEPVKDQDVVIWYGAHFKHDQTHGGGESHIVGPDLIPLKWQ